MSEMVSNCIFLLASMRQLTSVSVVEYSYSQSESSPPSIFLDASFGGSSAGAVAAITGATEDVGSLVAMFSRRSLVGALQLIDGNGALGPKIRVIM